LTRGSLYKPLYIFSSPLPFARNPKMQANTWPPALAKPVQTTPYRHSLSTNYKKIFHQNF